MHGTLFSPKDRQPDRLLRFEHCERRACDFVGELRFARPIVQTDRLRLNTSSERKHAKPCPWKTPHQTQLILPWARASVGQIGHGVKTCVFDVGAGPTQKYDISKLQTRLFSDISRHHFNLVGYRFRYLNLGPRRFEQHICLIRNYSWRGMNMNLRVNSENQR